MHLGNVRKYIERRRLQMAGAVVRTFSGGLLHDVLGEQPAGPGEPGPGGWLADNLVDFCPRCGASVDASAVTPHGCPFCFKRRLPWERVIRVGAYEQPLQDWILGMKFGGQWRWAIALGQLLSEQIRRSRHEPPTVVCPVPMHWARRWKRGFNQAHLIAQQIAATHDWPMAPLLHRHRYTRPQTAVAPSRRRANVRDSVTIAAVDLTGWSIWLVDDVKTSGATLAACAQLLRDAGAMCVNVAVVAVADPRGVDFRTI